MADMEPNEWKWNVYLLDSVSTKPGEDTDQPQGFEAQKSSQPVEYERRSSTVELPKPYQWKLCDMISDREANEVSNFMKKYYLKNSSRLFEFKFSKEYLQWSLCPPGFYKNWHIGVEDKSTKQLVAFIAAVPVKIRLHEKDLWVAEVKFLYVLEELRSLELHKVLISQMAQAVTPMRMHVAYAAPGESCIMPLATCHCWFRPLKVKNLIKAGFIEVEKNMTEAEVQAHSLPMSAPTQNLRKMEVKDIPSVTTLLQSYMGRFAVAPVFKEAEVEHWFLPREGVIQSYVVEKNNKITNFLSFAILPFSTPSEKDCTINSARSLYNVSLNADVHELLTDALVLARSQGLDAFSVIDIMDNGPVLEDLLFSMYDKHCYYLHGLSEGEELKPSEVGFVMF